jgi:hypothetical protein
LPGSHEIGGEGDDGAKDAFAGEIVARFCCWLFLEQESAGAHVGGQHVEGATKGLPDG